MILRTRQMMQSEAVPQHNIGVLHIAITRGPGRQAVVAGRLVDELACGETLIGMKRSHPDLMLDEPTLP